MSWFLPAAVIGSSLLGAGASMYGANQQARASRDAANAINQANAPAQAAGAEALRVLTPQVATPFEASPGYQFRFDEGVRALNRNMANQGLFNSGARGRALQRFGQGLASEEYNQYINRLLSLAGLGRVDPAPAASMMANAGGASGAGAVGAANAISGGVNNAVMLRALGML